MSHPYIARVLNSTTAKMNENWQTIGNVASAVGLTSFALTGAKGVLQGYQTFASPYTSLVESERKLERVRSRLLGLSPQRREEIEASIQSNASGCKSLHDLEEQLEECVLLLNDAVSFDSKFAVRISRLLDMYYRLFKGYEEVTFSTRHNPFSEFRKHVAKLERDAMGLLNDTLVNFSYCPSI